VAPAARGALFDLPHVVAEARSIASDRLALKAGDFFKDALPSCDAYLLMEVIHDWNDSDAQAILRAVRRAAPSHATLLVIEQMIPDDTAPHWRRRWTFICWRCSEDGKETFRNTRRCWRARTLFFTREIDTRAGVSILEAVAA
jgi:hypothetical protein